MSEDQWAIKADLTPPMDPVTGELCKPTGQVHSAGASKDLTMK